jgi:tetratricopeptide (TPR) repeat protein
MRLADIYLAQGADSAARAQLLLVQDMRGGVASEKLDVARLKLADMELWSGNVDSASAQYSMIAADPSSIAANDAIDRLLLLQLQQDDSTGVSAIIKAEQYFQRRQFAKAIDVLATQLASTKDQDLKDRGTFLAARSCIVMGDTLKAEPFLLAILQRIPESIYGDKALWLLASVSEFKTDIKSAMQYLESLLMNYPRSILIPDTRERIRKLRGDA